MEKRYPGRARREPLVTWPLLIRGALGSEAEPTGIARVTAGDLGGCVIESFPSTRNHTTQRRGRTDRSGM